MMEIKDIERILKNEWNMIDIEPTLPHKLRKFSPHKKHTISALIWFLGRKEKYQSMIGVAFKHIDYPIDNIWVDPISNKIIFAFKIDGEATVKGIRALRKINARYKILVSTGKNYWAIKNKANQLQINKYDIHHIII